MSSSYHVSAGASKEERYQELIPQLEASLSVHDYSISTLANVSAALKSVFGFFWVGFYLVDDDRMYLGPFQGDAACTFIGYGKGVCGTAWMMRRTMVVPDVEDFPGHIACSSLSRSEIVVPMFGSDGSVIGVLDIDSDKLADFDEIDAKYLEIIVKIVCKTIN
ncbi:MAG: GAF domain-containing protein [Bacteroidales bacterium]|nr:GAF domain-containing protein [Bacteroidales bacterium]